MYNTENEEMAPKWAAALSRWYTTTNDARFVGGSGGCEKNTESNSRRGRGATEDHPPLHCGITEWQNGMELYYII